jgi:SNF2 family DNA or RNA helicase
VGAVASERVGEIFYDGPLKEFKPAQFQVEDLVTLKRLGTSANYSEMGCYKTTTGLWWAFDNAPGRVLVITTRTGKTTYFEVVPHVMPESYHFFNVTATECPNLRELPEHCIVLAHYNCFTNRGRFLKELLAVYWDGVILDEAHRIKNHKGQWTKNIKKLRAGKKHIMTGTGFVNKPDEIWSLLNFLHPHRFSSYWRFRRRYCLEKEIPQKNVSVVIGINPDREAEFKREVNSVGVRRLKREVLKDLPDYYETRILVDLNPTQRRMYNEIKKELETLDKQGELITSVNVLSQLSRLRQICVATPEVVGEGYDPKQERYVQRIRLVEPSSKLDALGELIEGTDSKLIIFSNFVDPLRLAEQRLHRAGTTLEHLRVADRDEERAAKVRRFQSEAVDEGGPQVFLSTIPLGGESITLTAASTVIFLDRSWSPAANSQAISRAHRPGQKNAVQVINIEARSSVDSYVNLRLEQKQDWFRRIFST